MKTPLVKFSIARPKWVMLATAGLTLLFLTQFLRITADTNPKNMLPPTPA